MKRFRFCHLWDDHFTTSNFQRSHLDSMCFLRRTLRHAQRQAENLAHNTKPKGRHVGYWCWMCSQPSAAQRLDVLRRRCPWRTAVIRWLVSLNANPSYVCILWISQFWEQFASRSEMKSLDFCGCIAMHIRSLVQQRNCTHANWISVHCQG